MFKRFTNQHLLIALGVLGGLYLLSFMIGGSRARSFEGNVILVDTAKVDKLLITPSGEKPYTLLKKGGKWQLELANGSFAATEKGQVERALGSIQNLQARGLASRDKDQWGDFEVDESGLNLKVFANDKKLADVFCGKTFYQQAGLMSYVRKEGENETYMAAANLGATFGKKPNDWRDKALVTGDQNNWSILTFTYPGDSSFQLIKAGQNQWMFADSSATNNSEISTYIRTLSMTKGIEFVDEAPVGSPLMSLAVQNLLGTPFQISAYENGKGGYSLISSANPGAVFDGEGIVEDLFVGAGKFVFDPEE